MILKVSFREYYDPQQSSILLEAAKFDNTDPESKIGKKLPDFLTVLLTRFNGGPLPESGKPVNLTVGKFAVYLSGLMGPSTRSQLTSAESEALLLVRETIRMV